MDSMKPAQSSNKTEYVRAVLWKKPKGDKVPLAQKKGKKNVRNILVSPSAPFWPLVNPVEEDDISSLFNSLIEEQDCDSSIQKMKAAGQKNCLSSYKKKIWYDSLVMGVNSVARQMTASGSVGVVLIDSGVDPTFLAKHISVLSAIKSIPVLVIPNLRSFCADLFGVQTIVLGLKKSIESSNNRLLKLYETTKKISNQHRPPAELTQFSEETSEDDSPQPKEEFKKPSDVLAESIKDLHLVRSSVEEKCFIPTPQKRQDFIYLDSPPEEFSGKSSDKHTKLMKDMHLIRSSLLKKCFVPPERETRERPEENLKVETEDFMAFGSDSDSNADMKTDSPIRGISHTLMDLGTKPKKKKKKTKKGPKFLPFSYVKVKTHRNKEKAKKN